MSGVTLLINNPNVRQQFENKLFRAFDLNKDERLDLSEVQPLTEELCKQVGLTSPDPKHIESVFKACDMDNSGWLDLSQFDKFFLNLLHKFQRDAGNDVRISAGYVVTDASAAGLAPQIKITVNTLAGEVIVFELGAFETVGGVKDLIHQQRGTAKFFQRLLFKEITLDDEHARLRDIGIGDGAALTLLELENLEMKITVGIPIHRSSFGREYIYREFVIDTSYTILNIKELIMREENTAKFAVEKQRLVRNKTSWRDPVGEDSDLATDCGIKEGSELWVLLKGLGVDGGW